MDLTLSKGSLQETPQIQFWRNLTPFCRGIFCTNNCYLPIFATGEMAEELVKQPENEEIALIGAFMQYPYRDETGTDCIQDYIRVFGINQKPDIDWFDKFIREYSETDVPIPPIQIYDYNLKLRQFLSGSESGI